MKPKKQSSPYSPKQNNDNSSSVSSTGNIFNHKYGLINEALDISIERAEEIKEIIYKTLTNKEITSVSKRMESILNNGVTVIESQYAGYLLGRLELIISSYSKTMEGNPMIQMLMGITGTEESNQIDNKAKIFEQSFKKINVNLIQ